MFVLKNEFFYTVIVLTELNLKGDTNIYFKQITFFEKQRFCKNHTYFFLKPFHDGDRYHIETSPLVFI